MFEMTRIGTLLPQTFSPNQCKEVGETHYVYEVKCTFKEVLDSKGFLIDHFDIDAAIKNSSNVGSCEECLVRLANELEKVLPKSCTRFSISIKPWNAVAYLTIKRRL